MPTEAIVAAPSAGLPANDGPGFGSTKQARLYHGATVFAVNDFFFAVRFFLMIRLSFIMAHRAAPRQLMVARAERPVQGRAALSRGRLRGFLSRPLHPRPEVSWPGRAS